MSDASHEWQFGIQSDGPRRVAERFEALAQERGVPPDVVFKFQLALDELLTNVVSYAFHPSEDDAFEPTVRVALEISDTRVWALIEDNGQAFDPLREAPVPDVELPADDRVIGGLGIHLTKAFVETLSYERRDGWNRLTLAQPLAAHTEEHA